MANILLRLASPQDHTCEFRCPSCGAHHEITFDFHGKPVEFPQKRLVICAPCLCRVYIYVEGFAGDPEDPPVVNSPPGRQLVAHLERVFEAEAHRPPEPVRPTRPPVQLPVFRLGTPLAGQQPKHFMNRSILISTPSPSVVVPVEKFQPMAWPARLWASVPARLARRSVRRTLWRLIRAIFPSRYQP